MARIALTLGPVFFHWPADRLANFYRRIADEAAIDRVHIGEVVCGKRMPFSDPVWPEIIERLERGGKEVVLSTLAAPATVRERKAVEELCSDGRLVEINDITALPTRFGQPFVAGPFVNVYNEASAQFLIRRGARTICPPVELSLAVTGTMARACPEVEFELFAFGRLPLALSGRCYHARLHGLHKDSCQFTCEENPDGLSVDTLDGQEFLAVNGVQTLSHQVQAFCPESADLLACGVTRLRLSPQTVDMVIVAQTYRALLDGAETPTGARFILSCLDLPGALAVGFPHGRPGCHVPDTI
ncbi:Collagenase-like protease, PrtC family [Mesorhizobium albiziae]|uniref:Ubiquinone biosynthesis protein UbiV n=1 Tax=Neomesorhizobium albiziae TaxID=335020 RepID=A0A1I3ZNE4_9HYPH|nr:U32 family peptidase [Mesorhizobium albiziae]GLS32268.1 U32 family peptidase [Mesorhizobium albiziae]SFK45460.1 Collagenase-like protease, PrtC family [Mesorhizobium albiziae]